MGLFGKRNRKKPGTAEQQTRNTVQQPEELADALYVYLQKEGFFPERGTSEDTDAHRAYIYFKFQGFNVTMEISQNDYLRLIVVLEIDPDGSDCFNLMMAAFRTMYEMKAVKIVLGVKWIQFSVETFVASADAFTPFLMRYLDILTDAVGRHRAICFRFKEEKEKELEKGTSQEGVDNAMEKLLQDAVNAQLDNPVKS